METQKTKRNAVLLKCFVLNKVCGLNMKLFPLNFYRNVVKTKKVFELVFKNAMQLKEEILFTVKS